MPPLFLNRGSCVFAENLVPISPNAEKKHDVRRSTGQIHKQFSVCRQTGDIIPERGHPRSGFAASCACHGWPATVLSGKRRALRQPAARDSVVNFCMWW